MAKQKKQRKPRTSPELDENQQAEIKALREKIHAVKYRGSFKEAYRVIRKETVRIMKDEQMTEQQKKDALINACSEIIADLTEETTEEESGQEEESEPEE